jgi:hypothetical protein
MTRKHPDTDIGIYAQSYLPVTVAPGTSALRLTEALVSSIGKVGHATYLHTALAGLWNPAKHKRAIVFTDDQAHDSAQLSAHIPTVYTFDLGGYGRAAHGYGTKGRYVFGGFSDATMTGIAAIEQVGHTGWPFLG